MGLGPVGSITLARARELAVDVHRLRLEGLDPIKARDTERAAAKRAEARGVSFRVCAEQMMDAREIGWRNVKHRKQWRTSLLSYAYPVLGEIPVAGKTRSGSCSHDFNTARQYRDVVPQCSRRTPERRRDGIHPGQAHECRATDLPIVEAQARNAACIATHGGHGTIAVWCRYDRDRVVARA